MGTTRYVLGFHIDREWPMVALIRKARPAWQAGKLNGIGGHIEGDETPHGAMVREFREETGNTVPADAWRCFAKMEGAGWECFCFVARGELVEVTPQPDEPVELHDPAKLPADVLPNLHWLIPLALDDEVKLARAFYVAMEVPV